ELTNVGGEVMVADKNETALQDILPLTVSAKVCDCTKPEAIESFGVEEFDACFVCVGNSFQNCLEITDLLKTYGAKKVYSAADRDIEPKFLLRNGADKVIYPEQDIARRIAGMESSSSIFDCINISDDYAIFEIEVLDKWVGKSIIDIDFRKRYNLNIIAYKIGDEVHPELSGDYVFKEDEHILVLGHKRDVEKVIK
ncbi:MAG: TrkA family potassium uptake protein, partial [Acutalibacteraceae bacterium]|nr:TrkA family potassium uptake protein [Acutalibacteraceae bacterium]